MSTSDASRTGRVMFAALIMFRIGSSRGGVT
jgi:hypothetical protein